MNGTQKFYYYTAILILAFERLLGLSAVQVLNTYYETTFQDRKQIRSFVFWENLRLDNFVLRSTDL